MTIEQFTHGAEVALSTPQDVAVHRLGEWAQSADAAYRVADRLSQSAFVPQQFRGKPVELTAAILSGLEVGLSPMAAMRSFDIIQGQAAPRAITLRAVVQSHGHEMVLIESTATRCRMKGRRKGSDEWQLVTWTIERARDLSLTGKDNWKKQPAAMLVARATSELARLIASDAILGIGYSAEEIADGGTTEQQVAEVTATPQPSGGTRRMSRRTPDSSPAPDAPPSAERPDSAPGAPTSSAAEQPASAGEALLLNTSSKLAKALFAAMGDRGISSREDRLEFCSMTLGREVASSTELTEDDARLLLRRLDEMEPDQPLIDVTDAELIEEA